MLPPRATRSFRIWEVVLVLAYVALVARAVVPVHKYPQDADVLMVLSCAERVLEGEWPLFRSEGRNGSPECYLAAPWVALLGRTREAWVVIALAAALLTAIATIAFGRVAFSRDGRGAIAAAVLLAVPAAVLWRATFITNYWFVLFWMWLWMRQVFAIERAGLRTGLSTGPSTAGLLAVLAAIGAWQSLLLVAVAAPAIVWLGLRRRLSPVMITICLAALLVGIWPTAHVRWKADGRREYDGRPISLALDPIKVEQLGDGARRVVLERIPALLSARPGGSGETSLPLAVERGRRLALLLGYALAGAALARVAFARRSRIEAFHAEESVLRAHLLLVVAMAAGVLAVNVAYRTAAQDAPGLHRYLLPLAPLAGWVVASAVSRIARARVAVAVTAGWVALHLWGYPATWWSAKAGQVAALEEESRLLESLRDRRVEAILGGFWTVQPWNHLEAPRVLGQPSSRNPPAVPCTPVHDYLGVGRRLSSPGAAPVERWAMVGRGTAMADLEGLVRDLGEPVESFAQGRYRVVVFEASGAQVDLVDAFRANCREVFSM